MKSNAIVRIITWSIVAIFLTILLINIIFNGSSNNFDINTKVVKVTQIDANKIDALNFKWFSRNFLVTSYSGTEIIITEKSNKKLDDDELLEITEDNNVLTVEQKHHVGFFNIFNLKIIKNEIKLPNKLYKQLTVDFTSGKLEMNDVSSESLNLKMTSGNTSINNIVSNNVLIDITSGKVNLKGGISDIKTIVTSGSVSVESNTVPSKMSINITSGLVNIKIPDNDGFDLSEHKTSGSIHTDFNLDEFGKYKNGSREYSVKLTSGSFNLLKK